MLNFLLNFLGGLGGDVQRTDFDRYKLENVDVQVQADGGYWQTIEVVTGTNAQQITIVMDGVSAKNPGRRVRAVIQGTNRVLDIR